MAPQTSRTSGEPTLYEILSLTPKHLEGQDRPAQQKAVKQAYRRALLHHHPDKAHIHNNNNKNHNNNNNNNNNNAGAKKEASSTSSSSSSPSSPSAAATKSTPTPKTKSHTHYTVDQIQHAYAVLSDSTQRGAYDRHLRTQQHHHHGSGAGGPSSWHRHAGVETVDLDDAGFDERTGVYYRGCRCGNARGYAFTEADLEAFEDDGVLLVECLDCSLWLRVLFAAAADDDDDDEQGGEEGADLREGERNGEEDGTAVAASRGPDHQREGTVAGSRERGGYRMNWSFSWGFSLSGSATAGGSGR
ncbi:hypothetical protein F4779DRAFT_634636 [Xylariaceae sp. FL0662B]|nr:hypothetical protein F4779DRAFT_634636 [Xylariaceae sp. FL0662B]